MMARISDGHGVETILDYPFFSEMKFSTLPRKTTNTIQIGLFHFIRKCVSATRYNLETDTIFFDEKSKSIFFLRPRIANGIFIHRPRIHLLHRNMSGVVNSEISTPEVYKRIVHYN